MSRFGRSLLQIEAYLTSYVRMQSSPSQHFLVSDLHFKAYMKVQLYGVVVCNAGLSWQAVPGRPRFLEDRPWEPVPGSSFLTIPGNAQPQECEG